MTRRIVLLTQGGTFGRRLAGALCGRGVPIAGVVIEQRPNARPSWRTGARVAAKRLRSRVTFGALGLPITFGGTRNSAALVATLDALAPDLIVLGGTGILSTEVILRARHGVLNGHPALLPFVRGAGVVTGSLLRGVPLGATVHWVDDSIDTGPLVARRLLTVPVSSSFTLSALEDAVDGLAITILAEMAARFASAGELEAGWRLADPRPTLRAIEMAAQRMEAERLIRNGAPARLYQEWRTCIGSDDYPPSHPWVPASP